MAKKSTRSKKDSVKGSSANTSGAARVESFCDIFDGTLNKRRFGLRIDDDVVVYIVGGDLLRVVKGRVLEHKKGLHLVDEEGHYHRISYDWVTDIIVLRHNRPAPGEDPELRKKSPAQPRAKAAAAPQGPPTDQAYQ